MTAEAWGVLIGVYVGGGMLAIFPAMGDFDNDRPAGQVAAIIVFWPIFLLKFLVSGFMEAWKG